MTFLELQVTLAEMESSQAFRRQPPVSESPIGHAALKPYLAPVEPASEGVLMLDDVLALFLEDRVDEAMPALIAGLAGLRARLSGVDWRLFIEESCRPHPLMEMLLADPFTVRAFTKPRGYPGDAVMLDFVYVGDRPDGMLDMNLSPVGAEVYRQLNRNPTVQAVRARKRFMTRAIDTLAEEHPGAHILSVAAGHMREAQESRALGAGRLGRVVGLDQDSLSLDLVDQELGPLGVETVRASILQLLRGGLDLGEFDLIYAMGLYDYLRTPVATNLTAALFDRLRPGGRLLLANFHRDTPGAGYMEAFMDWWLLHRTADEVLALADTLPADQVASIRTIQDDFRTVVTLEVIRRD